MQWLMLQQDEPEDFVIATGKQNSVREFIEIACKEVDIDIEWKGSGVKEVGIIRQISDVGDQKSGKNGPKEGDIIVKVDKRYFRPY